MLKKVIFILTSACLLLTLAGCGGGDKKAEKKPEAKPAVTETK